MFFTQKTIMRSLPRKTDIMSWGTPVPASTPEAASNWNLPLFAHVPAHTNKRPTSWKLFLLCLFTQAQVVLHLAASGTVMLEASPGCQHSLGTAERKWEGNWEAWWRSEGHLIIRINIRRQWSLQASAGWSVVPFHGRSKLRLSMRTLWVEVHGQHWLGLSLPFPR